MNAIDLSQFHQVFFDESQEHLSEMERIFLAIDVANPDEEELHAVFRAAHSIKGGAATFGFPDMTTVTHALETLLDKLRHHELTLTSEMVEVFLQAGDAIGIQLAGHRDGADVDQSIINMVCERLGSIAGQQTDMPKEAKETTSADKAVEGNRLYHLKLRPQADFFRRMVRLEPILDELESMGELQIEVGINCPDEIEGFDPESCLTQWTLQLKTSRSVDEIKDVFLFSIDEEDIEVCMIHSEHDVITSETTVSLHKSSETEKSASPQQTQKKQTDNQDNSTIRVGISKVDQLINQVGELVITQSIITQAAQLLDPVIFENLHRGLSLLERNTRNLQESVMSIRMMPISFIFSRFPRLVHDLATKLGKEIDLKLVGETTELDKSLLEKLADPLTHLARNSLDHGIELPEQRESSGKPRHGTITLKASQQGGRVVVEVIDDGAGLNRERILAKAQSNGLTVSDKMTDEEVWQLIFAPGFSTAEQVTEVSGRGVGMDVVMRNVDAMGGRVSIFSQSGLGSRVVISLPLTLAILDGLSVRVGNETFIIPLNAIIESMQPNHDQLNAITDDNITVHVRDEYIPLIRLNNLFSIPNAVEQPTEGIVILMEAEGERVALLVDELLGQHQVVIKSLETNYRKVDGTAGATILGDGKVALILDAAALVRLWRNR